MTSPIASHNPPPAPLPPLEAIRRKEAEVKRRLAAEHESAQTAIAEAERQARELVAAAEAEGRRQGEVQRQAARAEAEREATAIVARARAEAETLQRAGEARLEAAIARAVKFMVDG
jgi:vacuolar-type H+-ATPase subunit H